jgi:glycosyltransferase involved in cell wall biosynthesis
MNNQLKLEPNVLSIVVPVYNGEDYLLSCLNCIDEVRVPKDWSLQVIVVDDGSLDSTPAICREFRFENASIMDFRVIRKSNGGESSAVNLGLLHVTGKYFLILSHDDLIFPEIFEVVVPILETDSDLIAVYPNWTMIDKSSRIIARSEAQDFSPEIQYAGLGNIPGPGTVIRFHHSFKSGLRDTRFHFFSDLEQFFRLGLLGKIKRVPIFLASWRSHGNNQSTIMRVEQMCRETLELVHEFTGWKDNEAKSFMVSAEVNAHLRVAVHNLRSRMPLRYGGRLHLAISLMYWVWGVATRKKIFVPSFSWIEIVLILINPIGRKLILRGKSSVS